jgi:Rrf2 family transcriptional regulator, iron-sulfur cluster assembly transcription factor
MLPFRLGVTATPFVGRRALPAPAFEDAPMLAWHQPGNVLEWDQWRWRARRASGIVVTMRLQVTRRADLAVKVLVALGGHARRTKATVLADELATSAAFLAQVVAPLLRNGWVQSDPGPTGGYTVTADLEHLTVLDVIEAVDGVVADGRCVVEKRACTADTPCLLHHHWSTARHALVESLSATTIADLGGTVRNLVYEA